MSVGLAEMFTGSVEKGVGKTLLFLLGPIA